MDKNISEASATFAAKYDELRDAEKALWESVAEYVYQLLKGEFPGVNFDRRRIDVDRRCFLGYEVATYRDITDGIFIVNRGGNVSHHDSCYANEAPQALYRAEGTDVVALVMSRNGRECRVRTYMKPSGSSYSMSTWELLRLVHEDTYGQEYIVLDGEKCYLEPLKRWRQSSPALLQGGRAGHLTNEKG